jgi:hypothetical protein
MMKHKLPVSSNDDEHHEAFITINPSSPTWHRRLVKHKQKIGDDERFFVLLFD